MKLVIGGAIAIALAVLSIIVSLLIRRYRKLSIFLTITFGLVGIVMTILHIIGPSPLSIEVVVSRPTKGEKVTCAQVVGGHCRISVEGGVRPLSGAVIGDDERLYVFLRASGSGNYWVGGESVSPEELQTGLWKVSDVGLGAVDSPDSARKVAIVAIVTTKRYGSGQNLSAIPDDAARSNPIVVSW